MSISNCFSVARSSSVFNGFRDCILREEIITSFIVTFAYADRSNTDKVLSSDLRSSIRFDNGGVLSLDENPRGVSDFLTAGDYPTFYTASGNAVKMTITGSSSGNGYFHTYTEYDLPVKFTHENYDQNTVIGSVDIPVPDNTMFEGGFNAGEDGVSAGFIINEAGHNFVYIKPFFDLSVYRLAVTSALDVSGMGTSYERSPNSAGYDLNSFFFVDNGKHFLQFDNQNEADLYELAVPYDISDRVNDWTFKGRIRAEDYTNALLWLPNAVKLYEDASQVDVLMIGSDYNDNNTMYARRYTLVK